MWTLALITDVKMKTNGSLMSPTQAAMLTVSQSIFAMSLSEENCATLKYSMSSQLATKTSYDPQAAEEKKITKDSVPGISEETLQRKGAGKRRHSSTAAPVARRATSHQVPRRKARSLTEIKQVDTEIIDGLFTTTLCSTELWKRIHLHYSRRITSTRNSASALTAP